MRRRRDGSSDTPTPTHPHRCIQMRAPKSIHTHPLICIHNDFPCVRTSVSIAKATLTELLSCTHTRGWPDGSTHTHTHTRPRLVSLHGQRNERANRKDKHTNRQRDFSRIHPVNLPCNTHTRTHTDTQMPRHARTNWKHPSICLPVVRWPSSHTSCQFHTWTRPCAALQTHTHSKHTHTRTHTDKTCMCVTA